MFLAGIVDRSGHFQVGAGARTVPHPRRRRPAAVRPRRRQGVGQRPRRRHDPDRRRKPHPHQGRHLRRRRLAGAKRGAVLRRHPEGLHRRRVRQPARRGQLHHHRTAARRAAGAHPVHRQQFRGGGEAGDAQPADVRRSPPHPRPDHLPGTDGGPDLHGAIHLRLFPAAHRSCPFPVGRRRRAGPVDSHDHVTPSRSRGSDHDAFHRHCRQRRNRKDDALGAVGAGAERGGQSGRSWPSTPIPTPTWPRPWASSRAGRWPRSASRAPAPKARRPAASAASAPSKTKSSGPSPRPTAST